MFACLKSMCKQRNGLVAYEADSLYDYGQRNAISVIKKKIEQFTLPIRRQTVLFPHQLLPTHVSVSQPIDTQNIVYLIINVIDVLL